jgi:hypothetical protein
MGCDLKIVAARAAAPNRSPFFFCTALRVDAVLHASPFARLGRPRLCWR